MLLLSIFLQGCGRKGPLILSPLQAANPQVAPAQSSTVPVQPSAEKSESKK
jgi:predicted small lipoprotein YifL